MSATATAPREPGSVYGRIITGNDVEQAALATLREYARRYIAEVERQSGREPGSLPEPRGYIVASQFEKWPEDQLPVVVVVSPGFAGPPRRGGDGRVIARWSLAVGVITSAANLERTRENALCYVAALRTLVAQQQALGGLVLGVELIDESYEILPFSDTRSLFSAQALFTVAVADALAYGNGPGGPWGPPPDPPDPLEPPEWGRVREASTRVVAVPHPIPFEDIELSLADRQE